jgi:hypothetical protein
MEIQDSNSFSSLKTSNILLLWRRIKDEVIKAMFLEMLISSFSSNP